MAFHHRLMGFTTAMALTATRAMATTGALGNGLRWTERDQGKQDRKRRHVTSHEIHPFHLP